MTTRYEHELAGCTVTPLSSYLKSVAVLRLIAEQAGDTDAACRWSADRLILRTRISRDGIMQFFLEVYEPSPLVAPWNGGSGFFAKDNHDGIDPLATTTCKRFADYRQAIETCRDVLAALSLQESPKNEQKFELLRMLRNGASSGLLRWMDAAVILSDESPSYPPLLGTGGNDGRLDFTNNFMQRLADVFEIDSGRPKANALNLLEAALFAAPTDALMERAIGQFAPGSAGGPNAASAFEGNARINPWDFILMLEGALLLAASAVRRMESAGVAVLSAPFTVRSRLSTSAASAASDDNDARGEIWLPIWSTNFTLDEALSLFAEGRASLGTRPARDGLDFARAVARLGVDRGISEFQRYSFMMRSGKAFLATPLARIAVRRNHEADIIDDLDRRDWLGRVQRFARDNNAPNAFRAVAAQLDAALFAMAQRSNRAAIERVLRQLGRIEALCARSAKIREAVDPVPPLSLDWALLPNDDSAEFRVALALAGMLLRGDREEGVIHLGLRPHLAPTTLCGSDWDPSSNLVCWGTGPLERNLQQVLHRRWLEATRLNSEGEVLHSRTGATLEDIQQFLLGNTDDQRITELLWGLACTKLDGFAAPRDQQGGPPLAAYAVLKPLFTAESRLKQVRVRGRRWLPPESSLRLPAELPFRLTGGDIDGALRLAWQRLRTIGAKLPGPIPPRAAGVSGRRLLAALIVPLTLAETARLLEWLDLIPESPELEATGFVD
jgi:CRISPR-associated protein Csx17